MATATPPRPVNRAELQRRVRHPLQSLRGLIRRYVTREGLAVAIVYLALWFWIGLALDYGCFKIFNGFDWIEELQSVSDGGNADRVVRWLILGALVSGLLALVVLKVVLRLTREFSDAAVALVLEKRFPKQLGDRLITAVEMADPAQAEQYGYSQALVDKTVTDAADRVERVPVTEVFNWARLRKLGLIVVGLTLGLFLVVGVCYCSIAAVTGQSASPVDFVLRFHDVATIWFERNILLMDSYWPRRCYLEVVRFQSTPDDPNEMRVGRDEQRPDVMVRALEWVVADRQVVGGWRALRWSDLTGLIDADLLGKVSFPADWHAWIIDLDDLETSAPGGILPADWQNKTAGEIRKDLENKAYVKNAIASARAEAAVRDLLDWRSWRVDKVFLQRDKDDVRKAMRNEFAQALHALEDIKTRLEELAGSARMTRRLRKLEIPDKVHVWYRGKTTKSDFEHEALPDQKYAIGLNELKESVRFTVQGGDYYTPYKKITLVPPPTLDQITIDKEEPAYIYHRLQGGDQSPLKGRKQIFRNEPVSVTGDVTTIRVPFGTNMTLMARSDRELRQGIRMTAPAASEERGAVVPVATIDLEPDRKSFSTQFSNIVKTIEFNFEFNDDDNVKGKRRILIRPDDDRAPEVLDAELMAILRKPRFRAEPGKTTQGSAADGFLITPYATLPFKGVIRDDYALTDVRWQYDVEQVEIELVGVGIGKSKLPTLILQGTTKLVRNALVVSGLQMTPAAPSLELFGPTYWAWVARVLEANLSAKRVALEGSTPLEGFVRELGVRSINEIPLVELERALVKAPPQHRLYKLHSLKDNHEAFDLRKYLPKLEAPDPTREPQLHYVIKLNLTATDNNVETGPNTGRGKAPFPFLVVSENELLAQIFIEEETLREKLEKVVFKLKNARTSLNEQVSKLSSAGAEVSLVAIRVDEVRKAVGDTASMTREVFADYSRILQELLVNNVKKREKVTDTRDKIVRPLEEVVNPSFGLYALTEDGVQKLFQALDDDANALRRAEDEKTGLPAAQERVEQNRLKHLQAAKEARDNLDQLILKLDQVLLAMDEGLAFGQLLNLLVMMEQEQRRASELLRRDYDQRVRDLYNLLKDKGK